SRLTIPVVDIRRLPEAEQEAVGKRLAGAEFNRPFDLEAGPLVRVVLIRQRDDEHTVVCVLHHIVSDGWSRGLLVKEISALYEAFSQGRPSPLRELAVQYADFAAWQRRRLQGDALEQELDYWKKSLAGAPPLLSLATDRPRPATQTYRGAAVTITLPPDLSEQLKTLSNQQGVTLFMTLLAAFKTLLYRYTSQEDIVVGTTVANRERADIEGLVGFFVNMLALRIDLSGNPRFQDLLKQVRETALKAYSYQGTPFERLVQELQPKRNRSYSPLFQVAFSLQNQPTMATLELPGLTLSVPEAEVTTTQFDLLLDMFEGGSGLAGLLQYNTDLFDRSTIVRMAEHFRNLLGGIVSAPERRLSELPLLSEEERARSLVEWNQTRAEYPRESCVHELFEARAESDPDRVAVSFRGEHLSYAELNRRANKVACYLRTAGVEAGHLVGVCMGHSPEVVVALLGALKAGAGYVPLDPEHPPQRLAFVLKDAGVSVVLSERRYAEALLAGGARAVCLDGDWPAISEESDEAPDTGATPQNVAYVIYTSGSTGEPKGVAVRHSALVNYVWWAKDAYLRGERLDFPLYSSLSFDLTVTSLYVPLVTGNRLVVYRQEGYEPVLAEILEADEVGVLKLTPGHLSLIKERDNRGSGVRRLIVGGEALTTKLAREVYESFGRGVEIYNEYGPTEATVGCMIYRFDAENEKRPFVPAGRPAPNARIYVLDRGMSPQAENMLGEMFVAGEGLAEGYWNRPDLTAERFVPDTFAPWGQAGQRMYRTGDLARLLPDATLEFVGRADTQVKLRGYRIELGEIESALCGHEAVAGSAVLMREDVPGDKRLVAYVVFAEGEAPTAAGLQEYLRGRLPAYMVPSAFVELETLPLTRNGKVDRKALPAPSEGFGRTLNLSVAYQEPRTEMEVALAATWREVLGVEEVGIYDDFFALGGHSLLATQIINRVNQTFQIDLPVRAIFDDPTVAGLSLLIEETLVEKMKASPEPV
ncbi:MAG: non-ribosomal peptide synthetase, partial [Pyrinomonadaceae bacterium]